MNTNMEKRFMESRKMNMEIKRLVDTWKISDNQAKLLTTAFENENLAATEFFRIMNDNDNFEIFSIEDAENIIRDYGLNNILNLIGFEEYMNDCLSQESDLERTYSEHPYLNHETNEIENPNFENRCKELLEQCEIGGDKTNS